MTRVKFLMRITGVEPLIYAEFSLNYQHFLNCLDILWTFQLNILALFSVTKLSSCQVLALCYKILKVSVPILATH